MKLRTFTLCAAALVMLAREPSFSQGGAGFSVEKYRQFLETHRDMSTGDLRALYDAGGFVKRVGADYAAAAYFDSIHAVYKLTDGEQQLLRDHGFVVTERLQRHSFGEAFLEIYKKDLPVFVSTDAILHALHMSWDDILMDVELKLLVRKLDTLLGKLHDQVPLLAARYSAAPALRTMVNDLDVYLTLPRRLLGSTMAPKFVENQASVQELLTLIGAEQPQSYKLFSEHERAIDFSQFTIRGHYTRSPELGRYFQAMIWLGRTEFYLIAPESDDPVQQSPADIQRQIIDAVLLKEAAEMADAFPLLEEIDGILRKFVGESDNVTLSNIRSLVLSANLNGAADLVDSTRLEAFVAILKTQSYAFQRINSQILMSDPMNPGQIMSASALLLLGQRFVIDSYTTGSVVYDKILYGGKKIRRMLPATLDVLFALGNDAAGQLLEPELDRYHYASNLAAVRYLVDSYESDFWQSSIYNGWLNSVRALNPPSDRKGLPAFMQTAAWWQEKMNTQLASWAQLRHDFILYAKQSYSAGIVCSFPEGYVEPIPGFYRAVKTFADSAASMFRNPPLQMSPVASYFATMSATADTLLSIAQKELAQTPLTEAEDHFLRTMLYEVTLGCADQFYGWYPRLYYRGDAALMLHDWVVADIHTAPTDEAGSPVGWVLHAGTGPLNLGVVVSELPNGRLTAFVGPFMSYYEHVSTNFKRLTDEEWKKAYAIAPSFRPSFTALYLANDAGGLRTGGQSLLTDVQSEQGSPPVPSSSALAQNYPNPFNSSTIIALTVPSSSSGSTVKLTVYDAQGRIVKELLNAKMPGGNFTTRWDGTNEQGIIAASGVYFYHLAVDGHRSVGKMLFVK